jgi:hypothetical protein
MLCEAPDYFINISHTEAEWEILKIINLLGRSGRAELAITDSTYYSYPCSVLLRIRKALA